MLEPDSDDLEELALDVLRRALQPEATTPLRIELEAAALVLDSGELPRSEPDAEELDRMLSHLGDDEHTGEGSPR